MVRARVSSSIQVRPSDLPTGALEQVVAHLTIHNEDRDRAIKRGQHGAEDLPIDLPLWAMEGDLLALPRGFAHLLVGGLERMGHSVDWVDETSAPCMGLFDLAGMTWPTLTSEQERLVGELARHRQGVLVATTGCLAGDTTLNLNRAGKGFRSRIDHAYLKHNGITKGALGPRWDGRIETKIARAEGNVSRLGNIDDIWFSGIKETYELKTIDGRSIRSTGEHPFLVEGGSWATLSELRTGLKLCVNTGRSNRTWRPKINYRAVKTKFHPNQVNANPGECRVPLHRAVVEADMNGLSIDDFLTILRNDQEASSQLVFLDRSLHVHHVDHDPLNNARSNLQVMTEDEHLRHHAVESWSNHVLWQIGLEEIESIKKVAEEPTYDVAIKDDPHNFLANGFVVHNSGKTVMMLELARRLGLRTLVLTEKKSLAMQWIERSREHLGYEPGLIGDGRWEERDITVAMLQTLHSRLGDLDEDWFRHWGTVVDDEAHHLVSPTYAKVIGRCTARNHFGITATPLDGDWRRAFLEAVVGPVVTRSEKAEMSALIKIVRTGFAWRPSKKDATLTRSDVIYRRVLSALIEDDTRNAIIARQITSQPTGATQLVVSKNLKHLQKLRSFVIAAGGYEWEPRTLMLRGEESTEEREQVLEHASERGSCVIFSTIAGEGLDVPRLDRLHLVYPTKGRIPIIQAVGRILRQHPDKLDPVVIDYVDEQGVLANQFRQRAYIYREQGWRIES